MVRPLTIFQNNYTEWRVTPSIPHNFLKLMFWVALKNKCIFIQCRIWVQFKSFIFSMFLCALENSLYLNDVSTDAYWLVQHTTYTLLRFSKAKPHPLFTDWKVMFHNLLRTKYRSCSWYYYRTLSLALGCNVV